MTGAETKFLRFPLYFDSWLIAI